MTDDLCKGRHTTATAKDDIGAIRLMTEIDKSETDYQQIWTSSGIDMSQVYKILHEHLTVGKLYIRWIPHNLTEAQKLRRVNWRREMNQRFAGGDSNCVRRNYRPPKAGFTVTISKPKVYSVGAFS
ncbi:hypothetical protein EVAR_50265_1 [Eumeta japonica]|uniref:Histone-lysine N-methyltransferase SETMAR n=1 Tax=Eumeta variegata TaxID=151549 RepID=A0A4C1Y9Z9_EUMVA|nr:hypothetical protein EVAR_50265_1 [Eumeta japonica]